MQTKIDSRCWECTDLIIADVSLLFTEVDGVKDWQLGPDGRTHWAPIKGWDRAACGMRVLRRENIQQK